MLKNSTAILINVGSKLAIKIPSSNTKFESYLPNITTKTFFTLKTNKSPGYDKLRVNFITKLYHELKNSVNEYFQSIIKNRNFSWKMKIAKVSSIFKKGDKSILSNYRTIYAFPYFSRILKCVMYNRLYTYLEDNNIIFNKQFGFRDGHSTEYALLELIDQIGDSFNKSYFLDIFINLSKAFGTVDHKTLLKKLQ